MSLGLFNCRLIQPAGDQLFFSSAVSPHRSHFGQALFSLLMTRPARPRPAGGRRMLLVFPSQKVLFGFFKGGEAPVRCRRLPPIQLRIPTKILNPTHRFCYRAKKRMMVLSVRSDAIRLENWPVYSVVRAVLNSYYLVRHRVLPRPRLFGLAGRW